MRYQGRLQLLRESTIDFPPRWNATGPLDLQICQILFSRLAITTSRCIICLQLETSNENVLGVGKTIRCEL